MTNLIGFGKFLLLALPRVLKIAVRPKIREKAVYVIFSL